MSTRYSDTSPEMLRIDPDDDPPSLGPAAAGGRSWAALAVAAIAIAGFGGVVAYGYLAYADRGASAPAPLIKADDRPVKVRPENPGGMEVPHQDKDIFALGGRDPAPPKRGAATTETLLPLPEAPLPKPVPQPVVQPVGVSPAPTASEAAALSAAAMRPAAAPDLEPLISTGPPPFPAPLPPPAAPAPRLASLQPQTASAPQSIIPTPASPSASAVTPVGRYRIQVGAMRSEAEARDAWDKVRRKHPDVLGAMSASYTRVDLQGRGEFYRVHVGPLPDAGAAREACARLAKGGTGCIVVPPS